MVGSSKSYHAPGARALEPETTVFTTLATAHSGLLSVHYLHVDSIRLVHYWPSVLA